MKHAGRCLGVLCLLLFAAATALHAAAAAGGSSSDRVDPDEGTLSSVRPKIPEPMVFDLVRPLGAKRGELEVNSLFRIPNLHSPQELLWAPEVEYTFADGMGVEFELPLENRAVHSYKAALQFTLPGPAPDRLIQGVQLLGEAMREGGANQVDLLHLLGIRWAPRWSTFSMTGVRREKVESVRHAPILNNSVFFERSPRIIIGLESNWRGTGASAREFMLMPQVHWKRSRINFQAGCGFTRGSGRTAGMLSWRITREF